jgi:hypothetical protein
MSWLISVAWLRFTVPSSSVSEVITLIGGDWMKDKKGFQGYTEAWLSRGAFGGLGRIGAKASWNPQEVHVDLSQELISDWTFEKFKEIATFVNLNKGHFGRIDVAFDDREGVVDIPTLHEAVLNGQCVARFKKFRLIAGGDIDSGADEGQTLALGSRQSDSYLRIYDKAAEQRAKGHEVEGKWIRYEMEWKDERAHAVACCLAIVEKDAFQAFVVGAFRSTVDFRDCDREDDSYQRCYAPVLPWWQQLTAGMEKARLVIQKSQKTIEDVKKWAVSALTPTLGILCAHPEAGEKWLVNEIVHGVQRWRDKHRALFEGTAELRRAQAKLRKWNPADGFSVALAVSGP